MTDEELDLLASSFLDGEATPEEVAMIERDPALLARVEQLRVAQAALRAPVRPASAQLKEDQLATALAAFDASDRPTTVMAVDEPAALSTEDPDATVAQPVIDLRARRDQRERRQEEAAGRMRWLSAVAGVLVFAAGAVFLIGQVGGGDDGEFAGDVPAADTEATESAEAQAAPADDATAAEMATAEDGEAESDIASEAMDADAEEDFAATAEESAADEATAADSAEAAAADDAGSEPTIRDLAEEGFFGDEPVATYRRMPTSDELLADLDLPWRNPESALCAGRAELPDNAVVIGYLPIEIPTADGETGSPMRVVEALYLTVDREEQVVLVDPDTCAVI